MNLTCPVCKSPRYAYYYKDLIPDTSIVKCLDCSHIFTFSTRNVDTDELYTDEVYKVVENRDSIYDKILNREYNKVLHKIDGYKPGKGYLLDFGCGKGKFGWLAKNDQWKVKCVETSPARAAYARQVYNLDVNTGFFESGRIFDNMFDVITLFHVLEHLPQPQQLLKELVSANLNKDGLLIIEVPNINSFQSALAKEKWMHLDVPRHINHFSYIKLKELTEQTGLTVIRSSYFSIHLGVLGMLDSLLKRLGYRKDIIYELKNRKSKKLILQILLILPFAIFLEGVSALLGKGGVIRMYLAYREKR